MRKEWMETVTGSLQQKALYRQAKARMDALPSPYHTAASACNRYLLYYGGLTEGHTMVRMFVDLADLWERASGDHAPLHAIVGDDPVEFAEAFAQAYLGKRWLDRERARLVAEIQEARRAEVQES